MRRSKPIALAAAFLIAGCGADEADEPVLRLFAFDCGRIAFDSPEALGFGFRDDETPVRELVVPCFVIEHGNGRLLWEGGLSSDLSEAEGWVDQDGVRLRLDRSFSDQLSDVDLDLGSFDYVAFSHMHFDHVGVANQVENATLLVQRPEFEAAFAAEVAVPFFDGTLYDRLMLLERVVLDGDHDVFGDGTVRLLSLPGHTPGHQALFVDLLETGPVVLSGDLYHFRISRERRIVPEYNVDADATLESMERLDGFLSETGAELWIEHDLERFTQLEKPPSYHN